MLENGFFGLIYKAIFPNKKEYVGQTTQELEERKQEHKNESQRKDKKGKYVRNYPFYCAIRKYGWESIKWEIICYCSSQEELDEKEIYYIKLYRTCKLFKDCNGYNVKLGGNQIKSYKFKENQIKEILEYFKKTGNVKETAKKFGSCYNTIYNIVAGKTYIDITKFVDDSFYLTYKKDNYKYSKEIIEKIYDLHNKNKTNREISDTLNINIRYIQDVLSNRTLKTFNNEKVKHPEKNIKKLRKDEIKRIVKEYYEDKKLIKDIALKHKISTAKTSKIINGKIYSDITGIKYVKNRNKILTKEDVIDIVNLSKEEKTIGEISKIKNVSENHIKRILKGELWNNVTHIVQ